MGSWLLRTSLICERKAVEGILSTFSMTARLKMTLETTAADGKPHYL